MSGPVDQKKICENLKSAIPLKNYIQLFVHIPQSQTITSQLCEPLDRAGDFRRLALTRRKSLNSFLVLVCLTNSLPIWRRARHPGAWQLFLHSCDGIYYIAREVEWVLGRHTEPLWKGRVRECQTGRERRRGGHMVSPVSCCVPCRACPFQSAAKVVSWGQTECNVGFTLVTAFMQAHAK